MQNNNIINTMEDSNLIDTSKSEQQVQLEQKYENLDLPQSNEAIDSIGDVLQPKNKVAELKNATVMPSFEEQLESQKRIGQHVPYSSNKAIIDNNLKHIYEAKDGGDTDYAYGLVVNELRDRLKINNDLFDLDTLGELYFGKKVDIKEATEHFAHLYELQQQSEANKLKYSEERAIWEKETPERKAEILESNPDYENRIFADRYNDAMAYLNNLSTKDKKFIFEFINAEGTRNAIVEQYKDEFARIQVEDPDRYARLIGAIITLNPHVDSNWLFRGFERFWESLGDSSNAFNYSQEYEKFGVNEHRIYDYIKANGGMDAFFDAQGNYLEGKEAEINQEIKRLQDDEYNRLNEFAGYNGVTILEDKKYTNKEIYELAKKGAEFRHEKATEQLIRDLKRTNYGKYSDVSEFLSKGVTTLLDSGLYVGGTATLTALTKNPYVSGGLMWKLMYERSYAENIQDFTLNGGLTYDQAKTTAKVTSALDATFETIENYINIKIASPSDYLLKTIVKDIKANVVHKKGWSAIAKEYLKDTGGELLIAEYPQAFTTYLAKEYLIRNYGANYSSDENAKELGDRLWEATMLTPFVTGVYSQFGNYRISQEVQQATGKGLIRGLFDSDIRKGTPKDYYDNQAQATGAIMQAEKATSDIQNKYNPDFLEAYKEAKTEEEKQSVVNKEFPNEEDRKAFYKDLEVVQKAETDAFISYNRTIVDAVNKHREQSQKLKEEAESLNVQSASDLGIEQNGEDKLELVNNFLDKFGGREYVEIYDTVEDMPYNIKTKFKQAGEGAKGSYYIAGNKIYLIKNRLDNKYDALSTLVHERTHFVRNLLKTSNAFNDLMVETTKLMGGVEIMRLSLPEGYRNLQDDVIVEEYLARVCERVVLEQELSKKDKGVWNSIKNFFKNWFLGEDQTLSSNIDKRIAEIGKKIFDLANESIVENDKKQSEETGQKAKAKTQKEEKVEAKVEVPNKIKGLSKLVEDLDKTLPRNYKLSEDFKKALEVLNKANKKRMKLDAYLLTNGKNEKLSDTTITLANYLEKSKKATALFNILKRYGKNAEAVVEASDYYPLFKHRPLTKQQLLELAKEKHIWGLEDAQKSVYEFIDSIPDEDATNKVEILEEYELESLRDRDLEYLATYGNKQADKELLKRLQSAEFERTPLLRRLLDEGIKLPTPKSMKNLGADLYGEMQAIWDSMPFNLKMKFFRKQDSGSGDLDTLALDLGFDSEADFITQIADEVREVVDKQIRLSSGELQKVDFAENLEAQRQYDEVKAQWTNPDGTMKEGYMLAPNGKPTNLTERQWIQVRTANFKNWFGDWENDPENASKVIDENGEPLVVYHGTHADEPFWTFKKDGSPSQGTYLKDEQAFFFAGKDVADLYAKRLEPMAMFLNIKNPNIVDVENEINEILWNYDGNRDEAIEDGIPIERWEGKGVESFEANDSATAYFDDNARDIFDYAKENGNDGIIIKGADGTFTYIAFNPNQIKSATDNIGTFDSANDDIRFSIKADARTQEEKDALNKKFRDLYEQYKNESKLGGNTYKRIRAYEEAMQLVKAEAERKGYVVKVYHGTGADVFYVAKADSSEQQNGEGVQAYGAGLYMAVSKDTAEKYRYRAIKKGVYDYVNFIDGLSKDDLGFTNISQPEWNSILNTIETMVKTESDIDNLINDDKTYIKKYPSDTRVEYKKKEIQVFEKIKKEGLIGKEIKRKYKTGHLFDWFTNLNPNEIIDRDKPIAKQRAKVKKAILKITKEFDGLNNFADSIHILTYKEFEARILKRLNFDQNKLSQILLDNGIKGLTYVGIEDGRCYVSFEGGSAVKLQDPFTFDDNGELIPLTERFDSSNPDMRFSIGNVEQIASDNLDREFAEIGWDSELRFSLATREKGTRAELEKFLDDMVKKGEVTKKLKDEILDAEQFFAELAEDLKSSSTSLQEWSDFLNPDILDENGNKVFTIFVKNGDYKRNIDFSTVCKKRRAFDLVLNLLFRNNALPEIKVPKDTPKNKRKEVYNEMSSLRMTEIRKVIKDTGLEVACDLCFVDAKRQIVEAWATQTANKWNTVYSRVFKKQDNGFFDFKNFSKEKDIELTLEQENTLKEIASGKGNYATAAKVMLGNPNSRRKLKYQDIIASEYLDLVKQTPVYRFLKSAGGVGAPKKSHLDVASDSDVLLSNVLGGLDSKKIADVRMKSYLEWGVRIQSFSDFIPYLFFDYVQTLAEISAKQLPMHTYTKESDFVLLFGLTGMKINMSLIPKVYDEWKNKGPDPRAGLDPDGNLIFADESFDAKLAYKIRSMKGYDKNCGIVVIGVGDLHILKLLDDDRIDMIIPYHRSGLNKKAQHYMNINGFKDYTKDQRDVYYIKTKNGGIKKLGKINKEDNFNFYESLKNTQDPKKTAQEFLAHCDKKGILPRFHEFRDHPNYYKLLFDFRVYDKKGKYAPQEAVRMKFPSNEKVKDLLKTALENYDKQIQNIHDKLPEIVTELEVRGIIDSAVKEAIESDIESIQKDNSESLKKSEGELQHVDARFLVEQDPDKHPIAYASIQMAKYMLFGKEQGFLRNVPSRLIEKLLPSERYSPFQQEKAIDMANRIAEKIAKKRQDFSDELALNREIKITQNDLFWDDYIKRISNEFISSGEWLNRLITKARQNIAKDLENIKPLSDEELGFDTTNAIENAINEEPKRKPKTTKTEEEQEDDIETETLGETEEGHDNELTNVDMELTPMDIREIVERIHNRIKEIGKAKRWDDNVIRMAYRNTLVDQLRKSAEKLTYGKEREAIISKINELATKGYALIQIEDGDRAGQRIDNYTLRAEHIALRIFKRSVRDTKQELLDKFEKLLRHVKAPKTIERADKRKMDAVVEARAYKIKQIAYMSEEVIDNEVQEATNRINSTETSASDDYYVQLIGDVNYLEDLQRFGALRDKNRTEIADAVDWLENRLKEEVEAQEQKVEQLKAEAKLRRDIFLNSINENERNAEFDSKAKKMIRVLINSSSTFKDLLLGLGRASTGKNYKAFKSLVDKMMDECYVATTKKENEVFQKQQAFLKKIAEIYKIDERDALKHILQTREDLQEFSVQAKPMSVSTLLQRLSMAEQSNYRYNTYIHCCKRSSEYDALETRLNELYDIEEKTDADRLEIQNLEAKLEAIEKTSVEEYANKIRAKLSKKDLKLLDWFRDFYKEERPSLSDANEIITGLSIPQADELYTPMKMLREGGTNEKHQVVAIVPKSMTPRVPNSLDMDESYGIVDMWNNRIAENAHYKAFSQLNIEWRGIFAHADFHKAVKQKFGEDVLKQLLDHFNDIMSVRLVDNHKIELVDKVNGFFAITALGFNFGSGIRQFTGIPIFANFIGTENTAKYLVTAWSDEGRQAMKEIFKSDTAKRRLSMGNTQAVVEALDNLDQNKFWSWYKRYSMIFNKAGDILPIMVVGQGIYRSKLSEYIKTMPLDEAKTRAMNEMWAIAEASQQSPSVMNMGVINRRGGSLGKVLTLFTSSPQLMLSREVEAMNRFLAVRKKYKANPQDEAIRNDYSESRKNVLKTLFINHVLSQGGYLLATWLWKALLGDDWDEKDWWAMIFEVLAGPFGSLIVFGRFITALNSNYGKSDIAPISALGNAIGGFGSLVGDILTLDREEILQDLDKIAKTLNAPYRDVRRIYKNATDKKEGDIW